MQFLNFPIFALIFQQSFAFKSTRTTRENGRIVGGVEIDIKDAPYIASMQFFGFHICGGSIISKTYILTAAHCLEYGKDPNYYSVRVGSTSHITGGDIHTVRGVYAHPFFNEDTFDYDAALLLLNSSITIDGITKKIVKLPFFGQAVFEMTPCAVHGWGETQNVNETNINLRSVTLFVSNQKECNKYYIYEGGVTWRMVCAFAAKKDSCAGDSGGPMVRKSDNKLVGIVSYGPANSCADPIIPGVYTRVSYVRLWIRLMARV